MALASFADRAAALDQADALARFRSEFHVPEGLIYLDGNSLGLLSRRAAGSVDRVMGEWRRLGIRGWTAATPPWVSLSENLARGLSSLIGAEPSQVCLTSSTTGNLHQLLATLFDPRAGRKVIVGDELNFASDAHAIQSHLQLRGLNRDDHYREIRSRDGYTLDDADIIAAFTPDVQLAVLPSVLFCSGQLLDMRRLARAARERGVLLGWDCSHSIGSVPHDFDADEIDFAFWCTYKHLNAGPGAVGGLYVNRRHLARAPGMAGWWGVDPAKRFALDHQHQPAAGAAALHVGTPHVLSLAPLGGSLELFHEAGGVRALRAKSVAQTAWLMELADAHLAPLGFSIITPRESARRGGHVAISHPEAWRICQALQEAGVVPDFRRPNFIRLSPSPFHTTYAECVAAINRLGDIVTTRRFKTFPTNPGLVP